MLNVAYFKTEKEALDEVQRRKSELNKEGYIARMVPTGYGDYKVFNIPADLFIDQIADGYTVDPSWGSRTRGYGT